MQEEPPDKDDGSYYPSMGVGFPNGEVLLMTGRFRHPAKACRRFAYLKYEKRKGVVIQISEMRVLLETSFLSLRYENGDGMTSWKAIT